MMRKLTCFPPYGKESQKTVILLDCPNVTLRGNIIKCFSMLLFSPTRSMQNIEGKR